jgi:hypothetical protein
MLRRERLQRRRLRKGRQNQVTLLSLRLHRFKYRVGPSDGSDQAPAPLNVGEDRGGY